MKKYFVAAATSCLVSALAFGQYQQWGSLTPGPYAVGYKTIRGIDHSRTYFLNAATHEKRARPMQVYVWYPAVPGKQRMKFGDYFNDIGYDLAPARDPEALRKYTIKEFRGGPLAPWFPSGLSDSAFEQVRSTTVPAFRNAQPVSGKFPVLLHVHVNGAITQSVMLEYLASHGYVVMSISMLGSSPAFFARGESGPAASLAVAEDLAYMLALAAHEKNTDPANAAMIGMIAQAGLSLQMKEPLLKAIACLDCSWQPATLRQLPYFNTRKVRIPILELLNTDNADIQAASFLDSLPHSQHYIGRFKRMPHADFYPFRRIAKPSEAIRHFEYEIVTRYTLQFVNAVLKDIPDAKNFLTRDPQQHGLPEGYLSIRQTQAVNPLPTENEFLAWLRYGEMEKVREAWKNEGKKLVTQGNLYAVTVFLNRDQEPQAYEALLMYTEAFPSDPRLVRFLNMWGYAFLRSRQFDSALQTFQLFVQQFPSSPYAYDGLGDVYEAMGEQQKAREAAEKAVGLIDQAPLNEQQKADLRKSANDKIVRLRPGDH